ncbi:MAG: oxidoreductase [Verrucomicrobiales bacterium]|nr:oxidoreductase [Verrucomicrobiales bacterium]
MTDAADTPFMVGVIALPLAGAVAAFVWPRRAPAVGLCVAGLVWIPVLGMLIQLVSHGVQHHELGGWAAPLGIALRADGLSVLLVLMVALVGGTVSGYAAGYFGEVRRSTSPSFSSSPPGGDGEGSEDGGRAHARACFWPLWLFLWAALNALLLSRDLFNLYVTLELLGLSAVALVALADAPVALGAAMRYLLVSLLGSLAFLLGVALVYAAYGTLDLPLLKAALGGPVAPVAPVALGLMTAGLLMKTALFPLHFWLPPAHANAPAPVSALLSALVVKASFYVLLRLWFEAFAGAATGAAMDFLGVLGAAAVLWGSYQALCQSRLKLLVAYSTVAQLGYLFLLFPLSGAAAGGFTAWAGGLYFVLAHACAKAVMFLSAGSLMRAAGHDRLAGLGETVRAMPVTAFAFALAAVSIIGLPPSGGFIAKWLLLNAALGDAQWWWVGVMAAGTGMAAAYALRVLRLPFVGTASLPPVRRVPRSMEWTTLGLALATLGLGFTAAPLLEWLRVGAPVGGPGLVGGQP